VWWTCTFSVTAVSLGTPTQHLRAHSFCHLTVTSNSSSAAMAVSAAETSPHVASFWQRPESSQCPDNGRHCSRLSCRPSPVRAIMCQHNVHAMQPGLIGKCKTTGVLTLHVLFAGLVVQELVPGSRSHTVDLVWCGSVHGCAALFCWCWLSL